MKTNRVDTPSRYLVFVDESGDHRLQNIDPEYPVFVLAFCIVAKADYSRVLLPLITEFKFRHFGHDQVILHEREIRKDTGDFSILRDRDLKETFMLELTSVLQQTPMTVIASAIRKDNLVNRYAYPNNPYEIGLGFGLERVFRFLTRHGEKGFTPVILECRGKREDDELELEFRRVCAGANYRSEQFAFEPRFVPKSGNVPGLQLADLVARPIGRYVLNSAQPIAHLKSLRKSWTGAPQARSWAGASKSSHKNRRPRRIRRGLESTGNPQSFDL